jgi:hypothetical protein
MRAKKVVLAGVCYATAAIALACVDTPTGPPRWQEEAVIGGTMFEAMYIATEAGRLDLAATATSPAVARSAQEAAASLTLGSDSGRANALATRLAAGSAGRANLSLGDGHTKRFKGRLLSKVVDGKRVDMIVIPDPDRAAGRPMRGYVTRIAGRVVSLVDFQYVRAAKGKWRRTSTRLTLFDSAQRRLAVTEVDHSGAVYAAATLRGLGGQVLGAASALFAPDALHAAEFTEYEAAYAGFIDQFKRWSALSTAAAVAAVAYQGAAYAAKAAIVASTAATVASALDPELIPAAEAAYLAMLAAQKAEQGALLAWAAATSAAVAAGASLADCMTGKPKPPGGGGGGGGGETCESGSEPICDWSMTFDGERVTFTEDNCYCEETWAT